MLRSSTKKYFSFLFLFFLYFLLFQENGFCRTPADLDRVIQDFEHSQNNEDKLKLSYHGLDLYAPITQKSQVDPDDRIILSSMKRLVLTDAMDKAGKDILVTAVGTTAYWVLKQADRIVNDYPAEDQDRIVQLKQKGCYMEGLSDLDFVVMGPDASKYQNTLYKILAQGVGDIHLVPEELERLEISFLTDDQVRDLASGPKGRKFWKQLMNLEDSSPHPEKYITKGGKALYCMEHLFEDGAVAVSNLGNSPSTFKNYANSAGHYMGPFTLAHLYGGSCDMDYFMSHALEKKNQESVKTVLQVLKYLKRQEWMLLRASKNINSFPKGIEKRPDTVESLKNYAKRISDFTNTAVSKKVWKSQQASAKFGKDALALSGLICSFANDKILETGRDLLYLRDNNKLTDETRDLLSLIVFDLETVDEERYPHKYPSWYSYETFYEDEVHRLYPRDNTLAFLKEYRDGKKTGNTKTKGPVISLPESKKKKKMDTGPILPPPVAGINIEKISVSPEKPEAGAPVTFTVSGSVKGLSDKLPDFSNPEYDMSDPDKMKDLGQWSLRATLYRMQIQYLMEQDNMSRRATSSTDKIYVSPYEISRIIEDFMAPAEDEISWLSEKLDRDSSDQKSGQYGFRVRSTPSVDSIEDYAEILAASCVESKVWLERVNKTVASVTSYLGMMGTGQENETTIFVTDESDSQLVWDGGLDSYVGNTMYDSRQTIDKESFSAKMAEIGDTTNKSITYVNGAIEYAEKLKERIGDLKGILNRDPATASKLAGEIEKQLTELASMTAISITGTQSQRLRLVEGIADAHLYMAKGLGPETEAKYRKQFYTMVEKWKDKEELLSDQTLPGLEQKAIWLNRGAWAAKSAKWGFEALTVYNKYQEDKAALSASDLSEGTENAVLALTLAGKAIEKVIELVPIPVLNDTIKSYASILSDAAKWATAVDSLQARRYQDLGFDIRSTQIPAAYKTIIEHDRSLDSIWYYRARTPLAEYNNLTILAYPNQEKTETGKNKRNRMWLIWDKHKPNGYIYLDKEIFEKVSLYTTWYRRVYGENISGENLHALLTKGKFETGYLMGYINKETITPETLKRKASTLLRLKAFEAYLFSLTGKESFENEELYTYIGMLYHAADEFAKKGFLLADPDVKEIMEAVFYENPIGDDWSTTIDIFSMSPGRAESINDAAAMWDKITGGEKERLENTLKKLIDKKVIKRSEEREKHWKEARNAGENGYPVATGLLYSEAGLVFKHALISKTGENYDDDYLDVKGDKFTVTWKTTLPGDTDYTNATYLCIAEIAGYPGTRIQFARPLDDLKNDILKQMLELAEEAEEIGNSSWSTCQNASAGIILFEERKEDFAALLEKLKKMNQNFNSVLQEAVQAPGVLDRNSNQMSTLSDKIIKNLEEIENIREQICEYAGSTDPGEKGKQIRLLEKMKALMQLIGKDFRKFKNLYEQSDKARNAYDEFENTLNKYESLLSGTGWARERLDGFANSLSYFSEGEDYKKDLSELKNKADALLAEAINVYSTPESESVLDEIKTAHSRVERPLNELKDCLDIAKSKKNENLPLYESINPELTKAELALKNAGKQWENLAPKKEDMETLGNEISELWQTTEAQFLAGENKVTEAEACMGRIESEGEAQVPDLSGLSMADAKNRVIKAGFKPVFSGGNSAPSKDLAYTVASQDPAPGEILSKGLSMNMILYGNFAGNEIPDVKGLTSNIAREKIEKAGFKPALEGGDPAPSEKLKYKVQSQEPEAGEKAETGTTVNIRLYGDIHYVNVPSIVNMTASQAKAAISGAGLVPNLMGGISAPKKSLSYRVEAQSPDPGTQVFHGSPVSILVYGEFNEAAALANANCNNLAGSILKWDYQKDRAVCACPSGMVINNAGNICIEDPRIQQERDRRNQLWSTVIRTAVPIIVNEITKDNNNSGGSRPGNTSGGNNAGGNTSSGGTGPSGGNCSGGGSSSGSSGLSYDECERKFCPECKDKGIDLIGVAVNDQCNDCRKRKSNEIQKCMSGEKTGPGTSRIEKDYMVVCYWEYDEDLEKEVCKGSNLVKKSPPPGKRHRIIYGPDTWSNCYKHTSAYTGHSYNEY